MDLTPEILQILEDSASQASTWHEIATPLRKVAKSPDDPSYVLGSAFDYTLKVHRREIRSRSPATFEPMIRMADGESVPPLLETVKDDWLELWSVAAKQVAAVAARARLHDLLSQRRWGSPPEHAGLAVAAYRALAVSDWEPLERADALVRALELARRFKLASEGTALMQELLTAALASLQATEPEPGVALSILRALVDDDDCPDEVDELLALARRTYHGAHHAESIIEIQKQRTRDDAARIHELDRERVEAWLDEAEGAGGLVRVLHFETAARIASEAGLGDLRETAKRGLQSIPKEDLDLERVTEEVAIPEEVASEYLHPFSHAQSIREALTAFVSHPPSTGDAAENRGRRAFAH